MKLAIKTLQRRQHSSWLTPNMRWKQKKKLVTKTTFPCSTATECSVVELLLCCAVLRCVLLLFSHFFCAYCEWILYARITSINVLVWEESCVDWQNFELFRIGNVVKEEKHTLSYANKCENEIQSSWVGVQEQYNGLLRGRIGNGLADHQKQSRAPSITRTSNNSNPMPSANGIWNRRKREKQRLREEEKYHSSKVNFSFNKRTNDTFISVLKYANANLTVYSFVLCCFTRSERESGGFVCRFIYVWNDCHFWSH